MSLNKEAMDNKPQKPLGPYLTFKQQKKAAYQDDPKRAEKIKAEWDGLDVKQKEAMQQQYNTQMEKYKVDLQKWKQKYDKEN